MSALACRQAKPEHSVDIDLGGGNGAATNAPQ